MSSNTTPAEEQLLNLLNRLRTLGPGQPPFEKMHITPSQFVLLDRVAASPGCGIQQVADSLGLTPPTVSVGVRRLEKNGLLERRPDPQDRRALRLFLTPQGETLHREAQVFRHRKAQWLLKGLTPEERERLLDLLERAIRSAEAEHRLAAFTDQPEGG